MENASSNCRAKIPEQQQRVVGHVHETGQADHDHALEAGHGRAAEAFADHDRAAPDRRDHHLAQESELPVPDDRRGREHRGEHHRDAEDAGVDEGLQAARRGSRAGQALQPGAQHEQEQERLDQRGGHPQAVGPEADQLPAPDDLDRPQLGAQTALGHADPDDLTRRRRGRARGGRFDGGAHAVSSPENRPLGDSPKLIGASRSALIGVLPLIICIITRLRCLDWSSSASRIVRAGVGHEHVVKRRPADADRSGSAARTRRTAAGRTARRPVRRTPPRPR